MLHFRAAAVGAIGMRLTQFNVAASPSEIAPRAAWRCPPASEHQRASAEKRRGKTGTLHVAYEPLEPGVAAFAMLRRRRSGCVAATCNFYKFVLRVPIYIRLTWVHKRACCRAVHPERLRSGCPLRSERIRVSAHVDNALSLTAYPNAQVCLRRLPRRRFSLKRAGSLSTMLCLPN